MSVIAVLLAFVALSPVHSPPDSTRRSLHAPVEIVFTTSDSGLTSPKSANAGYVRLALRNTSRQLMAHEIVRVRDGVPIAEGVRAVRVYWKLDAGDQAEAQTKLERFYGGAVFVRPGQTKAVGVTLPAGNYVAYADVIPEHGDPIVRDGYVRGFRVVASGEPSAKRMKPDVTIRMVEHAFVMPQTVKAGPARWRVENAGQELHLAFIARLRPGKTINEARRWSESEIGPSPMEDISTMIGVHALSAGISNDVELDLTPGEYVVACFIAGHHLRGMMQLLSVTP